MLRVFGGLDLLAHQANQELERNDFAITPYWEELWGWVEHYSHLLWVNNCP